MLFRSYKEALDKVNFNLALTELKTEILAGIPYVPKEGKARHLFGSAYTPGGKVDYYETIVDTMKNIIYINSSYVEGVSIILEEIVDESIKKGLFVEVYHEPMVETIIETIIIPKLQLALTSSKKYENSNMKVFDIDAFMHKDVLLENEDILKVDIKLINELLAEGLANMSDAKKNMIFLKPAIYLI